MIQRIKKKMLSKTNSKESYTDFIKKETIILDSVHIIVDTDEHIYNTGLIVSNYPVKHLEGLLLNKCTSERAVSSNLKYLDSLYYLECALSFGTKVALLCSTTDLLILSDLKRKPISIEVIKFKTLIIVILTPTI
ncbi:hypothetical protein QFZ37_000549 [Chryseobacterium ginsenosidimutans]|uniref:hypothetical protein n=1 Tax=Chryseobacterium ginsenosidimutans TaxID=687846 RepID=UPI002784E5F0|nr:hypothetical protein [Chryseobacterium ginsenosidimutans]MDQ0592180.1 hypothetical protein [Chryseobacterium ginsenosidimutans]